MKSVQQAARDSGIPKSLIQAVIEQLSEEEDSEELETTLTDVTRGGADAGFAGFTYYSDTVPFFKDNRRAIVDHIKQQARDFGTDVMETVKSFRCAKDEDEESIGRAIYGGRLTDADTQIANCLAWYALEEVARAMVDY